MRYLIAILTILLPLAVQAQVKVPSGANRFVYYQLDYGEHTDTTILTLERIGNVVYIIQPRPEGNPIRGYAQTLTMVDYPSDSITVATQYDDSVFFYRTSFGRNDLEWTIEGQRHTCYINSNRLEFELDEQAGINATPLPQFGHRQGLLLNYSRNGQKRIVLARAERVKESLLEANNPLKAEGEEILPIHRVSPREMNDIMKERLVVSTTVFDHVQLHWGETDDHIDGSVWNMPFNSVLHYAGGTIVLQRLRLPYLPSHYQHFVEIRQQSNGDAYDRTGSLFIIPLTKGKEQQAFFRGINEHPDTLPIFTGRDGERYQGMAACEDYRPTVEWVRFFTPFGVGHFNERMQELGIDWRNETLYRQEITDVYEGGDVIVGAWIGNYDGGGHRLSVAVKSYPNSHVQPPSDEEPTHTVVPLFNTCNVLEMAGQNYGKLFATDSLTVSFTIPADATSARLRYISTGHGGWGEGDEFVPKTNYLLIDGKQAFCHTPWRSDCATYRDLNPVSGNFWNGVSSSDLSRSGWCPGTATQPVYFDLSAWADGEPHTLTIAIPQGQPVEGMFSHWAVSGALIIDK